MAKLLQLPLVVGALLWAQAPQQSVQDMEVEIQKIKEEIAQEEKAWAEEKSAEQEKAKRREESYANFKREKMDLEKSIAGLEKEIKDQINEFEKQKQVETEYRIRLKRLESQVNIKTLALKKLLDSSFAYQKHKRLESVQILLDDIGSQNISLEEAFNRLYVNYENEDRLAFESEVYSGDFTDENGETFEVKYLRLGKIFLAFQTPDGTRLGLLFDDGEGGATWLREDKMDFETRKIVKQAIATADDKATPEFVPFPLQISSFSRNGGEE